ncbi:MAG: hypothetical protein WBC21_02215, partial [Minisyncoccales bacterium]
ISGSWRKINKVLEKDIRDNVREIINKGDGIITGGALNVDSIAADEALKLDPTAKTIKVFLPTTLEIFASHYHKRAEERVITKQQAKDLITQLTKIKEINPPSLVENRKNKVLNKETYYERNSAIVEVADELIAFHVNESMGTKDTINKAHKKGIPVKVFTYNIE